MSAQKWNPETRRYRPYKLPAETVLHTDNMDLMIHCANCGHKLTFGESYCSRFIHDDFGFGYPVCTTCYSNEIEKEEAVLLKSRKE